MGRANVRTLVAVVLGITAVPAASIVLGDSRRACAAPAARPAPDANKAAAPAKSSPPTQAVVAVADAMAEAALRFLAAIAAPLAPRAQHPLTADDRTSIKYVPRARSGVPLKLLTPEGRRLAHALLKTGLAQLGYQKATDIIALESILAALEGNPVRRDPENYYVWIFGQPARNGRWGWKFEGHHLSLNFTIAGGQVAAVPAFFGANPAEVAASPQSGQKKGQRILHAEEDLGRQLLLSFPAARRAEVIVAADAPADVLTADHSTATPPPAEGAAVTSMTAPQRELLRRLIAEYAGALPAPLAAARLARIDAAGFDKLRFAWAGSSERGKPHYYRVSGPTFVIEYDNTQNNGNHAHSVWRDFAGDFGRDLLREHLEADHGVGRTGSR